MSDNQPNNAFSHYGFKTDGIFKGFTKSEKGTYFASISLPSGSVNGEQSYVNISAVVGRKQSLQSIAESFCDIVINNGKGTSATVSLSNMRASNNMDANGNIRCDDSGAPFINYTAFLNEIAF